jgi:DNA ligase (NAD+)
MNIEGLGTETVSGLLVSGLIQDAGDLYSLNYDQLIGLEFQVGDEAEETKKRSLQTKSVENLMAGLEASKHVPFERVLFAMGIRHVGETTSKVLAQHFASYKKFIEVMLRLAKLESVEDQEEYQAFVAIDGIGEKMAQAVLDYFRDERNLKMVLDLENELQIEDVVIKNSDSKFAGKSIIFTGTLEKMTRAEAKKKAEDLGMKVVGSVSSKTDFVVAGNEAGSKLKKANELGLKILNEDDWLEMSNE